MLDEGFSNSSSSNVGGGVDVPGVSVVGAEEGGLAAEVERERVLERERRRRKEGALRFMVVIGNL